MTPEDREELERAKLKLEISELKRPIVFRPAFLGVLVSFLLGVFGFFSGLFDRQLVALKAERVDLLEQVALLEGEKEEVENESRTLRALNDRLENKRSILEFEILEMEDRLLAQRDEANDYIDTIKFTEYDRDFGEALRELERVDPELYRNLVSDYDESLSLIERMKYREFAYGTIIDRLSNR